MDLTLRQTVIGGDRLENDYQVIHEGRPIGRIRQADERLGHAPGWDWVIQIMVPLPLGVGSGTVAGFDEAKATFRQAWEKAYATLTPEQIAHWHHIQDAAAGRQPAGTNRPRSA